MGDRLVGQILVIINGVQYRNGADSDDPGKLVSVEIERRDDEAARATVVLWDVFSDVAYPEFNRHPNPRKVKYGVEIYGGWEDEPIVKMFAGYCSIKTFDEEIPSHTKFVAVDESGELRKYGRNHVLKGLSVAELLRKKAAEHGVHLELDRSVAGDSWLFEPMSTHYQTGEVNWDLMNRYIGELGYVTIPKGANRLVLMRDKSTGKGLVLTYGDEKIKHCSVREQQKQAARAHARKGHHSEGIAGKHAKYPNEVLRPNEDGRGQHWQAAPLAKDKHDRKMTLAKAAVMGKRKRRKVEGDELDCSIRLEPWMINHELITLSEFGPDADGVYHTRMVRHRMGQEWTTDIEGWRE
jgi:hypothetical protein